MLCVCTCLALPVLSQPDTTQRQLLLEAMRTRPKDPWPRGVGHVLLGTPGTPEEWKAYQEPGGSFSPAFGSFGVSFRVVDAQGQTVTTSDTLPLDQITQRLVWPDKPAWPKRSDLPAVESRTPYYDATWSTLDVGKYRLRLISRSANATWIVVRSSGPAGGPLSALHWAGDSLFINDRWRLTLGGAPSELEIVDPRPQPGTAAASVSWPAEKEWGYAIYRLLPRQEYWLTIDDARQPELVTLPTARGRADVRLDLPEPQFAACLNAQVAHILVGLVGNETRPGDPNNYPLNWLRDGAYVVSALARAGLLDTAVELCGPIAVNDFFGGFGAEADAPGLALWAMDEVAVRANDRAFDEALWPHAERKVGLILEMLDATTVLRKPFSGPIVPTHARKPDLDLVCWPAQDGLIQGRMDWHRPLLYVNAVSYRGLISAAKLATRVGRDAEAEAWRGRAGLLREAWAKALSTNEAGNERASTCGLYPTWVATDREAYRTALAAQWNASHTADGSFRSRPLWTYFDLARAHQWLVLGEPGKTWSDLHWFWANPAAPGLYTWWESNGEENTFGRWETVRGWVQPPYVTPHYWTAAEMILLQLDMLVCLDESEPQPALIVGAGVPSEWLDRSLSVEGVSTRLGRVDWTWNKKRLTVRLHGPKVKLDVKTGPAFPGGTEVRVKN